MADIKDEIQDIKNYFRYNPEKPNTGNGFYLIALALVVCLGGTSLWLFILPLLCMSYIGYRIIIILSVVMTVYMAYYIQTMPNNEFVLKGQWLFIWGYIDYYRDMYFSYKYKVNSFYRDGALENFDKKICGFAVLVTTVICSLIYGITQLWLN
ncbi:MAG: hypothetical protein E7016_03985 [Alphaproteobacteria bacterium]|nr:hypothetical protein [Alphaproteobacteria bacterium]